MTAIQTERSGSKPVADLIVDCDVHPVIHDMSALQRNMSARVKRRVFGHDLQLVARDPNRIPHPSSGLMLDAIGPNGEAPGASPAFAIEQWIDPFGISSSILIPIQAAVVTPWGDEQAGTEYLSALNRYFIEEWVNYDPRFRLAISISPYDVPGAVAEIEALAGVPGVAGIFVPHVNVSMGRSQLFPIYEAAERHGLPVLLHPTGGEGNLRDAPWLAGGLPDTYPERHAMLLQPGQAVLAAVVFNRVFEHFPSLKILLVEYGITWAASMIQRMDHAWELGDRMLAGLSKSPRQTVIDNIRFTTQPLDEPPKQQMLWDLLEMVHADRTVLFSSDYPHWDTDNPRLILGTKLPKHLRRRIGHENAIETFGARAGV